MRWSPPPVTLRQLQYLVAVGETRSFRGAAALCRVAQPSLSSQLAEAERALGVRVFERDRRRVLVTPSGEEVLRLARQLLVQADDLVEAATRLSDPLAGPIRIGMIPTIAPYLVPEAAAALRRDLPRLRVVWSEDRTAGLTAALQGGELDGAVLALEAELGVVDYALIARDPFVLATAADHPLARSRRPLHPADLDQVELLVLSEGHCLRDQALAACAGARASAFGATSLPTLVQMVAAGTGATLLPELALPLENRRNDLRIRRFARPVPGRTLVLAWRRGAAVAPTLRAVAAAMRKGGSVPKGRA